MRRLLTSTDPLSKPDSRKYDVAGNLTSFTDRRGQTSQFTYDMLNRLAGEQYQDGSSVARTYDVRGRLLNVLDSAGGNYSFTYDLDGRLSKSVAPTGALQYAYDAAGRLISRQAVGQPVESYSYDAAGNLNMAGLGSAAASFRFDADNELTELDRMNGVSSAFRYDGAGRLLSIAHSSAAGPIASAAYTYDAAGQRTSDTLSPGQPLLTQAVMNQYDPSGGRLSQSGAAAYTYDANGNPTSITDSSGTTTLTWDSRGRLASITTPAGMTGFHYDFAGNLIQQQGPSPALSRSFLVDGLGNVAYESSAAGDSFATMDGLGPDSHLAVVRADGSAGYALADALGSTLAVTDGTGRVTGRFFYEPFGAITSAGAGYPFLFAGRIPIGGSLYNFRARVYDSQAGRFLSGDPIGLTGGSNLYSYAGDDPVDAVDPSGLINTGTFGFSGGKSTSYGTFVGGFGFAVDSNGNVAPYIVLGGSNQPGGGDAYVGLSGGTYFNAGVRDLAGPFVNASVGLYDGVGGSVDAAIGCGSHGPVIGVGDTVGLGVGAGIFRGLTYTWVGPSFNLGDLGQLLPSIPNASVPNPTPGPAP